MPTARPAAKRPGCAGFTFAEVLAAMFFLAILVPVIVEGLSLSNRAGVVAERTALALRLADNQLNELLLDDQWAYAEQRGDFGDDWPGYEWTLSKLSWDEDTMVELTLEVVFSVQGREHRVRLSTLVDESAS